MSLILLCSVYQNLIRCKFITLQIIEFKIISNLIIDISLKICWRFSFMNLMLATLGAIYSTSWELHWCSIFLLQNSVALVRVFSHLHLCGQIWGILWRHCSGAGNSDSGITPRGKSNQIRYMYELTSTFIGILCLKLKKNVKIRICGLFVTLIWCFRAKRLRQDRPF